LWNISKKVFHADLHVPTLREEITEFSDRYRDKITTYPNELASTLHKDEKNSLGKEKIQTA
jgi:hypothetical protein